MLLAQFSWDGALYAVIGAALGYWTCYWLEHRRARNAQTTAENIKQKAREEAESLLRESRTAAKEEAQALKQSAQEVIHQRKLHLDQLESQLTQREQLINSQLQGLSHQQQALTEQETQLEKRRAELDSRRDELNTLSKQQRESLEKIAHLSEQEAKAQLLKEVEKEALRDASDLSRNILADARASAEDEAKRILGAALHRYAGEHTFENTTATVALQGDDIKGRIIGREGRNIRAFEAATGVTVLIDDTPNAVVLSGFDPVRREIAREAMHRLILDGRIHPTRIEEVVAKVSEEIEEAIGKAGAEAVYQLGLPPLHDEIVKLLGRLKFRRSYSQNILAHSVEVAHLTALLAAELNVDIATAKRAGLLHDIGKAVNHEIEGAHAIVGGDLIRRYGETEEIVNAVASHHQEVPHTNVFGVLVSAADTISASRPGARSETMTTYIRRLEDLEKIGQTFDGVDKCFAVQAGRELRVMVKPDRLNDEESYFLARNIARRIEEELHYPGQIRVTVVRETRCVEFAK
ncbi:MAG: ribonuclease Y [Limisphaerales bacterium]|jgi:ribonuclease Y